MPIFALGAFVIDQYFDCPVAIQPNFLPGTRMKWVERESKGIKVTSRKMVGERTTYISEYTVKTGIIESCAM